MTFASPFLEKEFESNLKFTKDSNKEHTIEFNVDEKFNTEQIFEALHPIDPRLKNRNRDLYLDDLDSSFEKSFLLEYIKADEAYIAYLLQHQRKRNTLGADAGNQGRVDFSFEIPYLTSCKKLNKFKKEVDVKHKRRYVIEVDGKNYHNQFIDDLKDLQINNFNTHISHVTEDEAFKDAKALLTRLKSEKHVKYIKCNYDKSIEELCDVYTLIYSPIGVARIQKIILLYLLNNSEIERLKLAVLERDVPCAQLAIDDLLRILNNLNELAEGALYNVPEIKLSVYTTKEFKDSPLHNENVSLIDVFDSELYDLIIDISTLTRSNTVKYEPSIRVANLIEIRNSHFIHNQTINQLISARSITYKDLVVSRNNDLFDDIPETKQKLEFFVQLLFRKRKFRVGQLPILNRALKKQSVVGLLPTGGGKSLTYQLAAMLQPGITIVIDPIRSLMQDQFDGLKKIGIEKAAFINSSLNAGERRYNQSVLLPTGQLQFVFVSPERFVIADFRNLLLETNNNNHFFSYAVIDEVHCVSEWGHDFRTPYLNLGENVIEYAKTKEGDNIPLFGLTATASFDVLADIERELRIPDDDGNALVRYENSVRNEINYQVVSVPFDLEHIEASNGALSRNDIGEKKRKEILELLSTNNELLLDAFNNEGEIDTILTKAYTDYLPDSQKEVGCEFEKLEFYLTHQKGALKLNKIKDFGVNEENKCLDASVVFCPHKKGSIGVFEVKKDIDGTLDFNAGFFVGASDGFDKDDLDKKSFENLNYFQNDKQNVMVATKAFGMGIDKPNVRKTIHINSPSSIESFVQEAGRAGRDRKLSLSTILVTTEEIEVVENGSIKIKTQISEDDEDVLAYFHRNSFKGKLKERQIIYELRNKIHFPNTTKFQQLLNEVNLEFGSFQVKLNWTDDRTAFFVNTLEAGDYIGIVNLQRNQVYPNRKDLTHNQITIEIGEYILERIKGLNITNDQVYQHLSETVVDEKDSTGIEKVFQNLEIGEEKELIIPFNNKYHPPFKQVERGGNMENEINSNFRDLFHSLREIHSSLYNIEDPQIAYKAFDEFLIKAIKNSDAQEFCDSLKLKDKKIIQNIKRKYYTPRSEDDTSKAIYRMISIGVIDSYSIDYANKLYKIKIVKKETEAYFDNLSSLLARYVSPVYATRVVDKLKDEYLELIDQGKFTAIGVCVKYLTDFVYDKIADKRKQAIKDMLNMCQVALSETSLVKQSEIIKDEIFYYFNAKYSRRENNADVIKKTSKNGKVEESRISVPASLLLDKDLDDNIIIEKYIALMNIDVSAAFNNNIKHLRGGCMRMLRVDPNRSAFKILKSFTLFILADKISNLLDDAALELYEGVLNWEVNNEIKLATLNKVRSELLANSDNKGVIDKFEQTLLAIKAAYFANWTEDFVTNFIKKSNIK
jgi:ATP-dependent DNA helicase RecQ